MGVYRNLYNITACNQPSRKWSRLLQTGSRSDRAGESTVLYVLISDAFIPAAGSNTSLYDCLIRVEGIFGENYAVKNNLKLACGFKICIFFQSYESQLGAKWTFFSIIQLPVLTPSFIALSASSKPSALPMATDSNLMLLYLLSCSTLKLGSNPGALDSKIGYLDLHDKIAPLKSIV